MLFLVLVLLAIAFAHDTWLTPETDNRVALSTGSAFPTPDSKVKAERIFRFFAYAKSGERQTLSSSEEELNLVVDSDAFEFGAELLPHEIVLDREKALAYLREENAENLLRSNAAEFKEEYTKFARFSRERKGSSFGHELELMIDADLVVPILRGAARKNCPIRLTSEKGQILNLRSGEKGALELRAGERDLDGKNPLHRAVAQGRVRREKPMGNSYVCDRWRAHEGTYGRRGPGTIAVRRRRVVRREALGLREALRALSALTCWRCQPRYTEAPRAWRFRGREELRAVPKGLDLDVDDVALAFHHPHQLHRLFLLGVEGLLKQLHLQTGALGVGSALHTLKGGVGCLGRRDVHSQLGYRLDACRNLGW